MGNLGEWEIKSVIFHAVTGTKLVRQIIGKLLPRAFVLLKPGFITDTNFTLYVV
jgi:hypothetical protein